MTTLDPRGRAVRRAVVTGVGIVSSIGIGPEDFWRSVVEARPGIRPIRRFDASGVPTRIAGEVDDTEVDPVPFLRNRKATKAMSRSAIFALVAAGRAARHAGLSLDWSDPTRVSVLMGSDVKTCGFDEIAAFQVASRAAAMERGVDRWKYLTRITAERFNPFNFLKGLPNMDAAHISIAFNAQGPSNTITTGGTAGTRAVGEAYQLIRDGEADAVFVGGTEAFVSPMDILRQVQTGGLTRHNEDPARAIRSFDQSRDGFTLGEGAAVLVVEEIEHARARGAVILAEVRGAANRCGGPWAYSGREESWEPETSIAGALEAAGAAPEDVDFVQAFGLATLEHDRWECRSIRRALGNAAERVRVTSIRPLVGVCGPASGAFDVAAATLSLAHRRIPPLANLRAPDPQCDLAFVREGPVDGRLRLGVTHAIELDGQSAAVVLAEPPGERP